LSGKVLMDDAGRSFPLDAVSDDVSGEVVAAPARAVSPEAGIYAIASSFLGAKIRSESPITITKKTPSETAMSSNFFFSIKLTMPLNE
jgi:hypothetical protein